MLSKNTFCEEKDLIPALRGLIFWMAWWGGGVTSDTYRCGRNCKGYAQDDKIKIIERPKNL